MEVNTVNEKQRAALKAIGGDDFVALIERTGEARTKELEESSVDYKDKTSYATRIRALAQKCDNADVKASLESFCKKLDKQFPPRAPAPREEEEEEEEERSGKADKKEDSDTSDTSDSKAADTVDILKTLGKELNTLASKAGGDIGTKLSAIAKEMTGAGSGEKEDDGKKEDEESKTEEAPKEDAPKGDAQKSTPDPQYVTVSDLKEVVGTLVSTIREEIKTVSDKFDEVRTTIEPLQAEVKDLSQSDEVKIAQKAEGVPVASLQDIMNELLGAETQISEDSKLAKKKPKSQEAEVPGVTGVPGLDWLIAQPPSE